MSAILQGGLITKQLFRCDVAGNRLEDLSDIFLDGTVSYRDDTGGGVPMTFDLQTTGAQRLDDLADFVSPYLTIAYDNGATFGPQRLGVFVVAQPDVTITQTTAKQSYPCEDLTSVLRDAVLTSTWKIPTGTNIMDAIAALIVNAGITKYRLPSSARVTGYNRAYPKGTTNLEAINKLCVAAKCFPVWMAIDGAITTSFSKLLSQSQPITTITDADYIGEVTHQPTRGQLGNVVVVRRERSDQSTLYAVRKNTDVDSPISIPNLGREILYTGAAIDATDAEDQSDVDDLADRLIEEARSYERTVGITVMPDTDYLAPHRVVDCDIQTESWDVYGRLWIKEWTIGMTPANVAPTLTLNRFVRFFRGEDSN
jgi:hypothetical protein